MAFVYVDKLLIWSPTYREFSVIPFARARGPPSLDLLTRFSGLKRRSNENENCCIGH